MGYRSDVALSFTKDDWEKEILPVVKPLDVNGYLDSAEFLEKDGIVSFRIMDYSNWGDDTFSTALDSAVLDYPSKFLRCGDDFNDVVFEDTLLAVDSSKSINLQWPAVRLYNEPYLEQADRMITNLMSLCLERGMTVSNISKALEEVVSKDIVENYANQAKEMKIIKSEKNTNGR